HGCAGPGNVERGWAATLGAAGYATLVLDSFGGRGLTEVCSSAWSLTAFQRLPDAYGALRVLSTHPGIDARRIALMGFSHGGGLTLGAATVWARERYASGGRARFRAFLPFYPSCNGTAPELDAISAPLRIHIGELDDWSPSVPCRERVAALRTRGYDADVTVYPGAHHAFDDVGRPVTRLARVDNGAACRPRARSILGPLERPEELVGCLKKGATIGWSREATDQARDNVRRQLADLLG
ncbi:MAG TPA: dienelactone hydrolase family protein, partial [Candidatus Limnocylindrales bacterium]|nr:dienelactone hydrolase family protein [Candidatus Limnocylindrales bacterium]